MSQTIPAAWASHALAHVKRADQRLVKRAQMLMTQLGERPAAPLPQACGGWSGAKAAHRFFDNPAVDPRQLLAAHTRATLGRLRGETVVLAVQDTTSLNYSHHPGTAGRGPSSRNRDKTLGLWRPSTLAVTGAGAPLGFLTADVTARDPRQFGSSRQARKRNRQPVADKESQRWLDRLTVGQTLAETCPDTRIINVAHREADIYERFAQALPAGRDRRVDVLVRSQHNRQLPGAKAKLWSYLGRRPVAGQWQVRLPRQPGAAARTATLSVRFTAVRRAAPGGGMAGAVVSFQPGQSSGTATAHHPPGRPLDRPTRRLFCPQVRWRARSHRPLARPPTPSGPRHRLENDCNCG